MGLDSAIQQRALGPPAAVRRRAVPRDQPGEIHSPTQQSNGRRSSFSAFWHGHIGRVWSHDVPSPVRYCHDLLGMQTILFIDRHYWLCFGSGALVAGIIGAMIWSGIEGVIFGIYWGWAVRLMIGHHVIWSINSFCHRFGHRRYETQERSTNLGALSIISFGESYHNNHHNDPASPRFGMGWREPNIDYWFIVACKKVGLATDRPLAAAVEGPSIA
ncbi:MAG: fatty acid desaturase [Casimicrobiaceae bacterium]